MFKQKLCSTCKTGKEAYELDPRSAECPYLHCYNEKTCTKYVKLVNSNKRIISKHFHR